MKRLKRKIIIERPEHFKKQLLFWSQPFREAVFLDSNLYPQRYSSFDAALAVDAHTILQTDHVNAFMHLKEYYEESADWLFGYLSYDLKNDVEDLYSHNFDGLRFPDLFFFQPRKLFMLKGNVLEILYIPEFEEEWENDLKNILETSVSEFEKKDIASPPDIRQRISRDEYLMKARDFLNHIHRGDIYEANFCIEFYAEQASIDPLQTYLKLNELSQPPFASFFRNDEQYILSASPERYIRKQNAKIISQPIKGTAKRFDDPIQDEVSKQALKESLKERSENVMIVDLVRNDLSRTALRGTVNVEELCEIYSFKQVHQKISTVVSMVSENISPIEILRTTFPMGSMTGAPKISAMQIIEALEETKRGVYSGAIGYLTPGGDFDFNVVIRSILYNRNSNYLSFSVGSAITANALPEAEYEECLLKAAAMFRVL